MAALIERDKNLTSFVVRLLSWQSHLSERQQTSRVKPSRKRANILQSLNVHNLASAERFQTRMQMNKPQRIDWVMILLPNIDKDQPIPAGNFDSRNTKCLFRMCILRWARYFDVERKVHISYRAVKIHTAMQAKTVQGFLMAGTQTNTRWRWQWPKNQRDQPPSRKHSKSGKTIPEKKKKIIRIGLLSKECPKYLRVCLDCARQNSEPKGMPGE